MVKFRFNTEESAFIAALIRDMAENENPCYTSDGTMCPFWDEEKIREDGSKERGECIAKRPHKTCNKLQYLLDGEYIMEIREKTQEDYARERQVEMQILQAEISQLDIDEKRIQQEKDKLQRKLKRIAKIKEDESDE